MESSIFRPNNSLSRKFSLSAPFAANSCSNLIFISNSLEQKLGSWSNTTLACFWIKAFRAQRLSANSGESEHQVCSYLSVTSGGKRRQNPKASVKVFFPSKAASNSSLSTSSTAARNEDTKLIQSKVSWVERQGGTVVQHVSCLPCI